VFGLALKPLGGAAPGMGRRRPLQLEGFSAQVELPVLTPL